MTTKLRGALSDTLTPREREVLALRAMGFDRRQTAKRMHVKPKTVAEHQAAIHQKLHTTNMVEAILRFLFARGRI